jgi:serine/threonine protein kinase/WD40 repeat protein
MNALEDHARSIFLAAVGRAPDEWPALLDGACAGNTELRARVDRLLHAHQALGSIHAGAANAPALTTDEPCGECPGTLIGPYKLLEKIGEGGFGVVFMAGQSQPVRRKVALKVLKPGMDTRQVVARFEAERQALAIMDHPHIAKVLDGGVTPLGRPYFVMELVKGVPITDFCDQNQLTPRQRLELFLPICQAVQHAHQKGIIHRDLKPSNILVTLQDGTPLVKVIDFGIAKALGQQLTDKTVFTGFAQMIGTPLYMSPEQAALCNVDVDTRSDIYSLGVLLYELLTGTTPFDKERLVRAGYDEMRRIIREEEPARPSTRLSTMGEAATAVSARRQSDPRRLSRLCQGELDWIVMKAIDKDRRRRYESAAALGADVARYLSNETVLACPPSAMYRFRKLAGRHQTGLLAALLIVLALVAGTAISVWQAIRATQAADAERQALLDLGDEQQATQQALLDLGKEQQATERELGRAQEAEAKATRELFESLLAQARANRLSRRLGQRYQTLAILRKALGIARQLGLPPERFRELRNEAIAALALPDLRVVKQWPGDAHVSFDATLERYASVDVQGRVAIRRAGDGKEIRRIADLGPGVLHWPEWAPDGSHLSVGDVARGQVHVWRVTGAEPVEVLHEPGRALCFSPDSRQVAWQQADGSIRVFELATRKTVRQLPALPQVYRMAFHPGGAKLAIACWDYAQVCDVESGKEVWKKSPSPVANTGYWPQVAWQPPRGDILALGDYDAISLWDVAKDTQVGKLEGIASGGVDFAFNPSGTLLANTGWSGIVRLWDPLAGRELFHTPIYSNTPRFSADGRFLAVNDHDKSLSILEIAAGEEYRTLVARPLAGKKLYHSPAFSPDGKMLTAGNFAEGVPIWDFPGGKELAFLEESPWNIAVWDNAPARVPAPGRTEAALLTRGVNGTLLRTIRYNPLDGGVQVGPAQKLPVPPAFAMMAQSRDGRVLAAAQFEGAVVWLRDQGDRLIQLGPHDDVRFVAVSPDGEWVVTGSHGIPWVGKVWEVRTGKPVRDLPSARGLCFSPDGKRLLTVSGLGIRPIRRWDVATWAELPFQEPLEGDLPAFSRDGKLLVLETGNGIARLVDAETGKEYARLEDPDQHRSTGYAFSPDGRQLVSATQDGHCVHVWDLAAIRRQLAELGLDWE